LTDAQALPAMDTAIFAFKDLDFGGLSFGVVTPPAGEGTALEENRGADAGTVMDGIFADVEDDAAEGVGVEF